jgi:septal ring factor EnvC (AmiA/AmiB activator)
MGIKKNMGKALEGMQAALEQESKGKSEAIRMKKKLEADVSELEMSLEHANANNFETQKAIKKYQQQIRDGRQPLTNPELRPFLFVRLQVCFDRL